MVVVWSNETVLSLIELYQNARLLWDTSHRDYKNKIKKNDAWEHIATTLNMPKREIELKIHNIRSQFLRERKKISTTKTTGSGRGDVHSSNWFAYDSLLFLMKGSTSSGSMDTMNTQTTESSSHNEMPPASPTQPTLSPIPPPQPATPAPPLLLQAPTPPTPPPSHVDSQKKRKNDDLTEVFNIMRSAKKKMDEPKDEFQIYAEYVASELRHINNEHAVLQAKYLINNILIEARMGKYNYTGYESRPSSSHTENYGYSSSSQSRSIPEISPGNDGVHDPSPVNNSVPGPSSTEVTQFENIQELVSHFDSQDP